MTTDGQANARSISGAGWFGGRKSTIQFTVPVPVNISEL